jgi:hypothetical protein
MANHPGDTLRLRYGYIAPVKDVLGNIISNPTSCQVQVIDANGTVQQTLTNAVNDGNGQYHYDYTIPANYIVTGKSEVWKFIFQIVNGGFTKNDKGTFVVEAI